MKASTLRRRREGSQASVARLTTVSTVHLRTILRLRRRIFWEKRGDGGDFLALALPVIKRKRRIAIELFMKSWISAFEKLQVIQPSFIAGE